MRTFEYKPQQQYDCKFILSFLFFAEDGETLGYQEFLSASQHQPSTSAQKVQKVAVPINIYTTFPRSAVSALKRWPVKVTQCEMLSWILQPGGNEFTRDRPELGLLTTIHVFLSEAPARTCSTSAYVKVSSGKV